MAKTVVPIAPAICGFSLESISPNSMKLNNGRITINNVYCISIIKLIIDNQEFNLNQYIFVSKKQNKKDPILFFHLIELTNFNIGQISVNINDDGNSHSSFTCSNSNGKNRKEKTFQMSRI